MFDGFICQLRVRASIVVYHACYHCLYVVYLAVPAYRTKRWPLSPIFSELVEAIEAPSEGASQLTPSWWQRTAADYYLGIGRVCSGDNILGEPRVRRTN